MTTSMERLEQVARALQDLALSPDRERKYDLVTLMRQATLAATELPGGRALARIVAPIVEAFRGASGFRSDTAALLYAIRVLQTEVEEIRLREEAAARDVPVEALVLMPLLEAGVPVVIVETSHPPKSAPRD